MRPPTSGRLAAGVVLATLLATAPAEAARKPITGRLSKPGYTVLAVADSGAIRSVRATPAFRIVPPGATATLQLRDATGKYAGMVVVGGTAKRAVLGVRAGARLGRIVLRGGYARLAKKVKPKWLNAKRRAVARGGVPVGAGNFGFVRVGGARAAQADADNGADGDADGVPDEMDAAPSGGLLLTNVDPNAPEAPLGLFSQLHLALAETLNTNANPGLTAATIDAGVARNVALRFRIKGEGARLDCGGLPYCTAGGTGKLLQGPKGDPSAPAFPECCSPDESGAGLMTSSTSFPGEFFLGPGTAAVGTGDTFVERGDGHEASDTLGFVFRTNPALKSFTSDATSTTVGYPATFGGPGSPGQGFVVPGDAPIALTMWRPQRPSLPGEPAGLVDLGHLRWQVFVLSLGPAPAPGSPPGPPLPGGGACPNPSDDTADDAPADPANTFTVTFDLPGCLASFGRTWASGDQMQVLIHASTRRNDNAAQIVYFTHG